MDMMVHHILFHLDMLKNKLIIQVIYYINLVLFIMHHSLNNYIHHLINNIIYLPFHNSQTFP